MSFRAATPLFQQSARAFRTRTPLLADNAVAVTKPVFKESGASATKKAAPSMSARFAWFFAGAAVSGGAGYYVLMQNLNKTAGEVQAAVGSLKSDAMASITQLNARVQQLEEEVKAMK
jgi:hypothetical protein